VPQQDPAHRSARPCGPIEDPMVILKRSLVRASHHAQESGHRSFSWSQKSSDQEHVGSFPHAFAQDVLKGAQHVSTLSRQIHLLSSLFESTFERSFLCLFLFVSRMEKV
jgi:hypothetical protein